MTVGDSGGKQKKKYHYLIITIIVVQPIRYKYFNCVQVHDNYNYREYKI